jgi:hypothetical protein
MMKTGSDPSRSPRTHAGEQPLQQSIEFVAGRMPGPDGRCKGPRRLAALLASQLREVTPKSQSLRTPAEHLTIRLAPLAG